MLSVDEAYADGRNHPRVHPQADREGLAPGVVVRLVYRRVDQSEQDREVWVEVTERLDGGYRGRVVMQSFKIWGVGEIIDWFEPEHVCAIRADDQ